MSDEDDIKLAGASKMMHVAVIERFMGKPMNRETIRAMDAALKEAYGEARRRFGKIVPEVTLFILPKSGFVEIVRKDADHERIQLTVRLAIKKFPSIQAEELHHAVRRAWPGYNPANFQLQRETKH